MPWSSPITWWRGLLEFSPMVCEDPLALRQFTITVKAVYITLRQNIWTFGKHMCLRSESMNKGNVAVRAQRWRIVSLSRSGGPESGEDPADWCGAESMYIPPPGEHSAACRVLPPSFKKNTFRSFSLQSWNNKWPSMLKVPAAKFGNIRTVLEGLAAAACGGCV